MRDACKPEVFLEFMVSVFIERGPVIREQNPWETMSGEHLVEGMDVDHLHLWISREQIH